MITQCSECGAKFEDIYRSTMCPHLAFPANDGNNKFELREDAYLSTPTGRQYDADYFLRGKETGKSLYDNYRWLPELTIPMAARLVAHCGIQPHHSILDFGCARGYLVRALREIGYEAWGVDISEWAVRNADDCVKEYLNWLGNGPPLMKMEFDWVVAKDVLEHIVLVERTITQLMDAACVGVFAVVPLGYGEDGYVVPEYDLDVTHVHRMTLGTWVGMFVRPGWSVTMSYRVPGIKDNYQNFEKGNGFITCRRLV